MCRVLHGTCCQEKDWQLARPPARPDMKNSHLSVLSWNINQGEDYHNDIAAPFGCHFTQFTDNPAIKVLPHTFYDFNHFHGKVCDRNAESLRRNLMPTCFLSWCGDDQLSRGENIQNNVDCDKLSEGTGDLITDVYNIYLVRSAGLEWLLVIFCMLVTVRLDSNPHCNETIIPSTRITVIISPRNQ